MAFVREASWDEMKKKMNRSKRSYCTVGHKNPDVCFHAFLMEAEVMTFITHCTLILA